MDFIKSQIKLDQPVCLSSLKTSIYCDFFEGFLKCPFESIVEAIGDVTNELEVSAPVCPKSDVEHCV